MFFALQLEDPNIGALHCQPRQPARSGGAVSKTTKTTLNHKKNLENSFVATFYDVAKSTGKSIENILKFELILSIF